jgi:hypothetical protein
VAVRKRLMAKGLKVGNLVQPTTGVPANPAGNIVPAGAPTAYQPAKKPTSSAYPGVLGSGRRAKPKGFAQHTVRVIGVGTRSVGEPLTGGRGFF